MRTSAMPAQTPSRRELQAEDLYGLADVLHGPNPLHAICGALEKLTAEVIGHRLFTVMRFDGECSEVQRIHSSLPAVYPAGGRKQKKATKWTDQVLGETKVFRGNAPETPSFRRALDRRNEG